jgi:uncharacterized phage protein gp47/JayE
MTRPTLAQLRTRVLGDLAGRTEGKAFLRRSVEGVLAPVLAALAHGLHGKIEWAERQQLPATADEAALVRWGKMLDVPRTGGTRAVSGQLSLTGTPGAAVPAGTAFRASNGAVMTTLADAVLGANPTTVGVEAREPGAAGNTVPADVAVSAVSAVAGMASDAVVTTPLTGGADLEDLELYRARVLDVMPVEEAPRGGGPGDYRRWAKEVAGVTEAWEWPHRAGVGTVTVVITRDVELPGGQIARIPDPGFVALVQQHIDAKRPLDMRAVYVRAPIATPVNMTLRIVPTTIACRDEVLVELRRLFGETAPDVALSRSVLDEAISAAPSETSHEITSITTLEPGALGLLTLGTVTFEGIA